MHCMKDTVPRFCDSGGGAVGGGAGALADVLAAARDIIDYDTDYENLWCRAEVLRVVAEQSAGEPALLAEVLAAARDIGGEGDRAEVLKAVAEQSAGEPALLAEVLAAREALAMKRTVPKV